MNAFLKFVTIRFKAQSLVNCVKYSTITFEKSGTNPFIRMWKPVNNVVVSKKGDRQWTICKSQTFLEALDALEELPRGDQNPDCFTFARAAGAEEKGWGQCRRLERTSLSTAGRNDADS